MHKIETNANIPMAMLRANDVKADMMVGYYSLVTFRSALCFAAILECSTAPHCSSRRSSLVSLLRDTLVVEFYVQLAFILLRPRT